MASEYVTDPKLLAELDGGEGYVNDPKLLAELEGDEGYVNDPAILSQLEEAPVDPKAKRRAATAAFATRLQEAKLFNSATTAFQGARDKNIRKKPDGTWDLPLIVPEQDNAAVDAIARTTALAAQKIGARLDSAGMGVDQAAIQEVVNNFQREKELSDDDMAAVWSDLGAVNRTFDKGEKSRVLSDGTLFPNTEDPDWLDTDKATAIIDGSNASPESKALLKERLPQIQTEIAKDKAANYEAAASAVASSRGFYSKLPGGVITNQFSKGFTPPSEWAEKNSRTDIGTPQFVLDYEKDVINSASESTRRAWGLAGKTVTGGNKVATTVLGILGAAGSQAAGDTAAAASDASAAINRGLPETGIAGSIIEELPSLVTQLVTGRLLGTVGALTGSATVARSVATLGSFGAAGLQSAGMTYADEIAAGETEERAREKAGKAGASTAIITAMFGVGAMGGIERYAAGGAADATLRNVITMAREQGIRNLAKSPELRTFAKGVILAAGGEAAEEGIDQLVNAFLTADPDDNLADAWAGAVEAAKVGGVLGGGIDIAAKLGASPEMDLVLQSQVTTPDAAAEAAKDIAAAANLDSPADAPPAAGSEPAAGILSDEGTDNDDGAAVEPGAADREAPGVGAADAAPDSGVPAAGALEPVASGSPADVAPAPPAEVTPTPNLGESRTNLGGEPAPAVVDATVEASDYAKARAADPALPSAVDAVTAAFAAGRPVSVSMVDQAGGFKADGSGLQTPEGYTRRGNLMVPPFDVNETAVGETQAELPVANEQQTAPVQTTPAAEAAPDTTGRGPSVPPAVGEAGTPAAQDTPVAETTAPTGQSAPQVADEAPAETAREPEPDLKEVFETLRGRSPEAAKVDTESPAFKGLVEEVRQKRAGRLAGELKRRQAEAAETRARMEAENTAKRKERERKKTEAKATRVLDKHEARIKEITGINHDDTPKISKWMKARGYNGPLGKKKIAIMVGEANAKSGELTNQMRQEFNDQPQEIRDVLEALYRKREKGVEKRMTLEAFKETRLGDIISQGKLRSRKWYTSRKLPVPNEYDGVRSYSFPAHWETFLFSSGENARTPDQVANAMEGGNLQADGTPEPGVTGYDVDRLWSDLKAAAAGDLQSQEDAEEARLEREETAMVDFFDQQLEAGAAGQRQVETADMRKGDKVTIDGVEYSVVSVDAKEDELPSALLRGKGPFDGLTVSGPVYVEGVTATEGSDLGLDYDAVEAMSIASQDPETYGTEAAAAEAKAEAANAAKPYSIQALQETFDLNPDQAVSVNALVRSMGLDTSKIQLKRGGRPGQGALNQFAGENANVPQFMRDSLETAKAMAAEGKDSETIRKVTGWFPGKYDGKMRWELPDENASFDTREFHDLNDRASTKLGDLLNHDALFEAYPELADVEVVDHPNFRHTGGAFDPSRNVITLGRANGDMGRSLSTLLHEVQHVIQKTEGFAKGSSPTRFAGNNLQLMVNKQRYIDSLKPVLDLLERIGPVTDAKIEQMTDEEKTIVSPAWNDQTETWKTADDIRSEITRVQQELSSVDFDGSESYRRTAGEIEARDVEARAKLTAEQRAATEPYSSENIDPETAVVLFQGPKGSFEYTKETGDILLRGLTDPDVSTAIHELAHAARRTLLNRDTAPEDITPEDIKAAEDWAGAKDGKWDTKAEEKFARGFERYFRDGKAPNQQLAGLFTKIGDWLKSIYTSAKGTPLDVKLTPEIRALFDKLVTRNQSYFDTLAATPAEPLVPEPPAPELDRKIVPDSSPTGLRHADTDADRERMGLRPRFRRPATLNADAWDAAIAAEDAHKAADRPGTAGTDLLTRLLAAPARALTPVEHALLLHEKLVRQQEVERAYKDLNNLPDGTSFEDRKLAQARAADAQASFDLLITYAEAAGTASGLSLQARKMMVEQDFSIAAVSNRMRAEKNVFADKPQDLTAAEQAEAVALAIKLQAAQERAASLASDNKELALLVEKLTADVEQAQKAARPKDSAARAAMKRFLDPKIAAAKARLEARNLIKPGSTDVLYQSGPTPQLVQDIADVSMVAAGWLVNKVYDLSEFTTRLAATFGDWVIEHAEVILGKARQNFNESAATVTGRGAASPQQVMDGIDSAAELTRKDVWDLARAHVVSGARGTTILDTVFDSLSPLFPDLTRERVAELFTDYGRVSYPSKDKVSRELRLTKTLETIAQKLADVRAKQAPKHTGFQREELTDGMTDEEKLEFEKRKAELREKDKEFRKAYRELEDEMMALGVPLESSTRRLKSALGAAKRRMDNEIEELQLAISKNERRTDSVRAPIPFDEEALDLKSRLEAKRQEYAAAFPVDRTMTPEKRAELVTKALDRQIAEEEKMLADGIFKRPKGAPFPDTPETLERRRKLAELRQTRRDLYEAQNPGMTALEQAKAAAVKSIERLEAMLKSGEVAVKQRKEINPDAELEALWASRDALSDEVAELRKALPVSPEKEAAAIRRALEASQKTLARLEDKIARGDITVPPMVDTPASRDAAVQGVRARIKDLNKELARMRREAKPKMDPEEARLHRALASIKKRGEELERRLRENDFSEKAKPVPLNSAELRKANNELDKLKVQYQERLNEMRMKNASVGRKLYRRFIDTGNLLKVVTLGGDLGVIFRQLGTTYQALVRDSKLVLKSAVPGQTGQLARNTLRTEGSYLRTVIGAGLKAFFNPQYEKDLYDSIVERPGARWDKLAGMVYASPYDTAALKKEDLPPAKLIETIPWWVWPALAGAKWAMLGVSPPIGILMVAVGALTQPGLIALDRAQRAMTNKSRSLWFDASLNSIDAQGTPTVEDAKLIAKYVMVGTGRGVARGAIGVGVEAAIPVMNQIFLATRFYISRIQALFGVIPVTVDVLTWFSLRNPENRAARKEVAKMYGRSVSGRAAFYTVALAMFGKADDDDEEKAGLVVNPFSKDFGRLRLTEKLSIDFMSGINGFASIISRYVGRRRFDEKDQEYKALGAGFSQNLNAEVVQFLAGKRNLTFAYIVNTHAGAYFGGKPVTAATALEEATTMIIVNDTVRIFEELGPVKGAALWAMLFMGAGTSVRDSEAQMERLAEQREAYQESEKAREERLNER